MSEHQTSQIQQLLEPIFDGIKSHVNNDPDFYASATAARCTFAITSYENPQASIIVGVENQHATFSIGPAHAGTFAIQARPADWKAFFAKTLVRPYQSYWGILRVLGHNEGIGVLGDQQVFGQHARIWRIVLDRARDALQGKQVKMTLDEPPEDELTDEDAVTGKYTWLEMSEYGKVKIFYETSGSGPQDLLFLHTAGSDSRQYHSLMNNKQLQQRCTMYAFDLPAHGRSSLGELMIFKHCLRHIRKFELTLIHTLIKTKILTGSKQSPLGYALNEESYLESIGKLIKKLKLHNTIVCGASMAGHVCIAAAIKARELDVHGAIPCEGCEHLAFSQPIYEIKGADASILDPERVIGMCAPTASEYLKRQIWWQYSSQGINVFSGDLKFYFRGWDGRGRVEGIDTNFCPMVCSM